MNLLTQGSGGEWLPGKGVKYISYVARVKGGRKLTSFKKPCAGVLGAKGPHQVHFDDLDLLIEIVFLNWIAKVKTGPRGTETLESRGHLGRQKTWSRGVVLHTPSR